MKEDKEALNKAIKELLNEYGATCEIDHKESQAEILIRYKLKEVDRIIPEIDEEQESRES